MKHAAAPQPQVRSLTAARPPASGFDMGLLSLDSAASGTLPLQSLAPQGDQAVDLFICPNEVSPAHGTGLLALRMIEQSPAAVLLRSRNDHDGRSAARTLAEHVLGDGALSWRDLLAQVAGWLRPYAPRMIVAIPYYQTDVLMALAAQAVTEAPLVTYLMDDNCLHANGISRDSMTRLLDRSALRLAISPELRNGYQVNFQKRFETVPPLVADRFINDRAPADDRAPTGRPVLIGNIWDPSWLELLKGLFLGSRWELDWYGGGGQPSWLDDDLGALQAAGIHWHPHSDQATINAAVREAPFVVVPAGTMVETGYQFALAKMSLPSRIPFIMASTGTPILVLGHAETGAARFVQRFDLGAVAPYTAEGFQAAATALSDPARLQTIRRNAAGLADRFRGDGLLNRLRDGARTGLLADWPMNDLFAVTEGEYTIWCDAPLPATVSPGFQDDFEGLRRLAMRGYRPDFLLDIGASTGIWSYVMSDVFPSARFVLADPLHSRYPHSNLKPGFTMVEAAVSDTDGVMEFQVSDDFYNSSLVAIGIASNKVETVQARVVTVDTIVAEQGVTGRGILKVDVQYAEHQVLAGAARTLADMVDFVLLELTLERAHPSALTLTEMINLMAGLGYRYFDDVGGWRSPRDGTLEQKDVLFVRVGLEGYDGRVVAR